MGDDNIDLQPYQLSGEFGGAVASPLRITNLKRDILANGVAEIAQASRQGLYEGMWR
jgi:hypothetical protein